MRTLLLSLITLLLASCSSFQGYVNQEAIATEDSTPNKWGLNPKGTEIVTYVQNVDELISVYQTTKESETNLDLSGITGDQVTVQLGHKYSEALNKIAEDLDQVNSENYPLLFTTFLGLNANPSNADNRNAFWGTLQAVISSSKEKRTLQLKSELEVLNAKIELAKLQLKLAEKVTKEEKPKPKPAAKAAK